MVGLSVTVWLSSVGLGLVALPKEVASAILLPGNPAERIARATNAVDLGAQSQGWWMNTKLASPGVVNLGNLNITWQRSSTADLLGVRLGVLNTTLPIQCDGQPHVVLQMDSITGDYSAKLSRLGGTSGSNAARIEYTCTPAAVALPAPAGR